MKLGIKAAAEKNGMEERQKKREIGGRARHTQNEKRAKEPEEILEDREEISQTVILLFRRLVNKKEKENSQPTTRRIGVKHSFSSCCMSSRNEN